MKKKAFVSLIAAAVIATAVIVPSGVAFADSSVVVTLGADLDESQKNAILQYFGVYGKNVDTITITNQDERDHLASYIPIEQIGTHTYSCAIVQPTTSGGIQVRTANLSYVTSNMIATTLSTAGVSNCNVIAASPFEVSGTGALTGVIMAYETATGSELDSTKKDLANQELVTTGTIAQTVGQNTATEIVNDIKIQVIEGQVVDQDEVDEIVDQVLDEVEVVEVTEAEGDTEETEQQTVTAELSEEDKQMLKDLAQQIADQQYNYDDMKATLDRVSESVSEINDQMQETETSASDNSGDTTVVDTTEAQESETAAAQESETAETQSAEDAAKTEEFFGNSDATALEELNNGEIVDENGTSGIASDTTQAETAAQTETEAQTETAAQTETETQTETAAQTDTQAETVDQNSGITITTSDSYSSDGTGETTETSAETTDQTTAETETAAQEETAAQTQADTTAETQADTTAETTAETAAETTAETAAETQAVTELAETEAAPAALTLGEIRTSVDTEAQVTGSILRIYIANPDLQFTSGTLDVTDPYGTVTNIDLTDTSVCRAAAMTDTKLAEFEWTEGTEFVIDISRALTEDGDYTLALSADATAAQAAEGTDITSAPTASVSIGTLPAVIITSEGLDIAYTSLDDFDVTNMTSVPVSCTALTNSDASNADVAAEEGETEAAAEGSIESESAGAVRADIAIDDTTVISADAASLDLANGVTGFTLTPLAAGETNLTVTYYDSSENVINTYTYTITVF